MSLTAAQEKVVQAVKSAAADFLTTLPRAEPSARGMERRPEYTRGFLLVRPVKKFGTWLPGRSSERSGFRVEYIYSCL